jgi:hypothetical protein
MPEKNLTPAFGHPSPEKERGIDVGSVRFFTNKHEQRTFLM